MGPIKFMVMVIFRPSVVDPSFCDLSLEFVFSLISGFITFRRTITCIVFKPASRNLFKLQVCRHQTLLLDSETEIFVQLFKPENPFKQILCFKFKQPRQKLHNFLSFRLVFLGHQQAFASPTVMQIIIYASLIQ